MQKLLFEQYRSLDSVFNLSVFGLYKKKKFNSFNLYLVNTSNFDEVIIYWYNTT